MACYARVSSRGETRELPDVAATSCGVDIAVFNSALLTRRVTRTALAQAVADSSTHFTREGVGWSFWLCDDLVAPEIRAESRRVFDSHGLTLVARPPGMLAERVLPPARSLREVECRPIEDGQTRLDFAHISSIVFALPFSSAKCVYAEPALWQWPMKGWVGYVNQKPVSIVTVVIAADAIGVYSLGTLPQYQGCGYGEALLRHAISECSRETGLRRSILQTTNEGFNLYLRMGYRVVTTFSVYTKELAA
jgi:ribosomal protein S18 acetylase RimI-like enzyme